MSLISVIVPVYKVEKYLDRCVESIVNQTYKDLEIILVDDGSPDKCPEMCDEWAEKDSRIKVIHKENGGLSDARNVGIQNVTGEYISFVDSDDYISETMHEELLNDMECNNSDISICGVDLFWDNGEVKIYSEHKNHIFSKKEAIKENIVGSMILNTVWNKLYRTNIIKNIKFKVGKQHEDVAWTYLAIANADKISLVDSILYHYYQNSSGIMGVKYSEKRFDAFDALYDRYIFMNENFPEFSVIALQSYCGALMYNYQYISRLIDFDEDGKYRNIIYDKFCDTYCKDLYTGIKLKYKVWMFLFKLNPDIYSFIRNKLKIGL